MKLTRIFSFKKKRRNWRERERHRHRELIKRKGRENRRGVVILKYGD